MLARFEYDFRDADFPGLCQRVAHQGIGPLTAFLGFQVVRLIEVQWIDLFFMDKFDNWDCLGQFNIGFIEILVGDLDVLTFLVFVPPGNFFPRNLDSLLIAESFVRYGAHVLLMEVVE